MRRLWLALVLCLCMGCANPMDEIPEAEAVVQLDPALDGTWYYDQMDLEEKGLYNQMFAAVNNWEPSVQLEDIPVETVEKVQAGLTADHPELFQLAHAFSWKYEDDENLVRTWLPSYVLERPEYESRLGQVQARTEEILAGISGLSDYEKAEQVHDWLVSHVEYVSGNMETDGRLRPAYRTVYGALMEGQANCAGYTQAFTWLMHHLDIPVLGMYGNALDQDLQQTPHEWNAVQLDGQWLFVDVTYDDPTGIETPYISHAYFGAGRAFMGETHDLGGNTWGPVPVVYGELSGWYRRNGLLLDEAAQMEGVLADQWSQGQAAVMQFSSPAAFEEALQNFEVWIEGWYGGQGIAYTYVYDRLAREFAVWVNV